MTDITTCDQAVHFAISVMCFMHTDYDALAGQQQEYILCWTYSETC